MLSDLSLKRHRHASVYNGNVHLGEIGAVTCSPKENEAVRRAKPSEEGVLHWWTIVFAHQGGVLVECHWLFGEGCDGSDGGPAQRRPFFYRTIPRCRSPLVSITKSGLRSAGLVHPFGPRRASSPPPGFSVTRLW